MRNKILFILFSLPLFLLIFSFQVFAQNNENKDITLNRGQVINSDYFASGDTITISGTVNGDAYVAGGNIIVDGTINGDLLTAGGNITVKGRVTQDIRAAGGNLVISGNVGKNMTLAGGSILVTDNARIAGSVVAGGGNVSIDAPIGKGLNIGAGQLTISNSVNGNVNAGVGNLTLLNSAIINGDLDYWSDNAAKMSEGASISGKIQHKTPPQPQKDREQAAENAARGIAYGLTAASFFTSLVLGLLLVLLVPRYMDAVGTTVLRSFWKSLLAGVITMVGIPFIILLLFITIIGIPLGLITLILYIFLFILAKILAAYAIGLKLAELAKWKIRRGWIYVIGLIAYTIIAMIPIIGWLVSFVVYIAGLGAFVLVKKDYYTSLKTKKII